MRILLVEDNVRLADAILESLYKAGFEVDVVAQGEEALSVLHTQPYDAVVLDLGLPDVDGLQVLKGLRAQNNTVPVLVLTARGKLSDKILGLNSGADDYMVKPFEVDELIARLKALLRRPSQATDMVIRFGGLSFDTVNRHAQIGSRALDLSRRELDLLEQLVCSADRVVTKKSIEQRIYSYGDSGSANSVEVLVHRLRKKLAGKDADIHIHTLKGIGYMLASAENRDEK